MWRELCVSISALQQNVIALIATNILHQQLDISVDAGLMFVAHTNATVMTKTVINLHA